MWSLTADLTGKAKILHRLFRAVLPAAEEDLAYWEKRAREIPDPELRGQALGGLRLKWFHVHGGSVYAAGVPRPDDLVSLIVSFQTISDYLDNLCDRGGSLNEANFERLHRAMTDAVDLTRPPDGDYYALHPYRNDGGYLPELVAECRNRLAKLPAYPAVRAELLSLVEMYNRLQVLKHAEPARREETLRAWFAPYRNRFRNLYWWEFAAAAGSTLGIFSLFAAAGRDETGSDTAARLVHAYFPWICGLHILLDYLIDQREDGEEGDLNFIRYYRYPSEARSRLLLFYRRARGEARLLPDRAFHTLVVDGLVGLYLSDRKVEGSLMPGAGRELLLASSPHGPLLHRLSRCWRRMGEKRFHDNFSTAPPVARAERPIRTP